MNRKKSDKMPRPRKYDYKYDKPTKLQLRLLLPVWAVETLQNEVGFPEMSENVENFLIELAEKNRKKD